MEKGRGGRERDGGGERERERERERMREWEREHLDNDSDLSCNNTIIIHNVPQTSRVIFKNNFCKQKHTLDF